MATKITPSDEALAWAERQYPHESNAEKYRLAQAHTLLANYRAQIAASGGKARAKALTAKQRKEGAKLAAKARWAKKEGKP
jgi:hypothetical protein